MAVSRSRSVCSFRGGGFNDTDEGSDYRFSSAKISDVTGGILMDSSDEPRKSGFRSIFPVKESDFTSMDDSAFIDLKLDLSLESKSDYPYSNGRVGLDLSGLKSGSSNGAFGHSGSCRMTRSGGKGNKVWKWIFKQSSNKS
uniref:Putative ovule protein n=1 Tax=Solanum chacoense TaxID=4108 RepID=A0A0V0HC44_SOLCH